jgi:hypothetical protein
MFGDDFPEGKYGFLLRRGAVAVGYFYEPTSEDDSREFDESFWLPIEELATRDGLCVTRCWDRNGVNWLAPMVVLARPDGSEFPYPPDTHLIDELDQKRYDKAREIARRTNAPPPEPPRMQWRHPDYLPWIAEIEAVLGDTLVAARRRAGVAD